MKRLLAFFACHLGLVSVAAAETSVPLQTLLARDYVVKSESSVFVASAPGRSNEVFKGIRHYLTLQKDKALAFCFSVENLQTGSTSPFICRE
jgi:hypothetical protein